MGLTAPIYQFTPREQRTLEFLGYNKRAVIEDGEMRDMKNLCSDNYPNLSQRKARGIYAEEYSHPTAMISKDGKLAVIDSGKFSYAGMSYPQLRLSDNTKMVAINTKICFFPEKKYFDTVIEDIGDIEARISYGEANATITTNTITFSQGGLEGNIRAGDVVEIKAVGASDINTTALVEAVSDTKITFPADTYISLIAEGEEEKTYSFSSASVERTCPELDYVMEHNNRLWGVSSKDNTIYACKLGDPTNWYYYQSTSMDSYAATQGTDGEWTGCAAYSSHLLFFKEDYIHKVYGSKPSAYQIESAKCHALEKGSSKSVAIINNTVIYKSRLGIMAYSGGTPTLISDTFGTDRYRDVIAGTNGIKYIMSVIQNDKPRMYTYDMERALWHIEDDFRARDFCYHDGKLLCIRDNDDTDSDIIYELEPIEPVADTERIEWAAELGPFDEFIEDKKVYSRLKMRVHIHDQSEFTAKIKIDDGDWETIEHINAEYAKAIMLPIVPRRCDKFSVRFEGKGRCHIQSLVREYRRGTIKGGQMI